MDMNHFIYYYLLSAKDSIDRNAPGTTFKEVSGKRMKNVPFPLPPLGEQKRIVQVLDHLSEIIRQIKETSLSVTELRNQIAPSLKFHVLEA